LSSADQHDVSAPDGHALRPRTRVEIVSMDLVTGFEPRASLAARDVQQNATADNAVPRIRNIVP